MTHKSDATKMLVSRRHFLKSTPAFVAATGLAPRMLRAQEKNGVEPPRFTEKGDGFAFDTGKLKGMLHADGESVGLRPLVDVPSGKTLSRSMGIFSHYRLLAKNQRFGNAAWSWKSTAALRSDGSVTVNWQADAEHPFDLEATYRWAAPEVLDVTSRVTAKESLAGFEIFLASYFDGFADTWVYAGQTEVPTKRPFLQATEEAGIWQIFPRNEKAETLILDGRWKQPPHPVDWTLRAKLHGPMAMRRDAETGLVALVMAPPDNGFAIATPHCEEPHRSLYLSLLGDDLKPGQSAVARSRLVVGRDLTFEQALSRFRDYTKR